MIRPSRQALLLVCLSGHLPVCYPAEWPAQAFEVIAAEPDIREVVELNPVQWAQFQLDGGVPSGRPRDPQLGAWLNDIGTIYQSAGHLAPELLPIVEVNGVDTYRAYVFPFAGSAARGGFAPNVTATYQSRCAPEDVSVIPWLAVNQRPGSNRQRYLGPLVHEMMHALAEGDRMLDECHGRAFTITEGIPNGAAMYIYKLRSPGYTGRVSRSNSAVGLRSYALSLTYGDEREKAAKTQLEIVSGYGAGSMWFFIAERFGGMKVFPHFTGRLLKKDSDREDILQWLDAGLQSLPGLQTASNASASASGSGAAAPAGLYEVYPAFVTEFAAYGGERYLAYAGRAFRSRKQARETWLKSAFNGCKAYTLTPAKRVAHIPLTISQNAARCYKIRLEGFAGNITSNVEVIADRLDLLDQLHLGWAWKLGPKIDENCYALREKHKSKWPPCIYKTYSQTGPSAGRYARTWPLDGIDFGASPGAVAERYIILSNVAVKPWRTRTVLDQTLKVAVADSILNGQPAEPVGPLPANRKRSGRAPVIRLSDLGKEELYGLQTDPVEPDDSVTGFSVLRYAPNRFQGAPAVTQGGYGVQINALNYGDSGPIHGHVTALSEGMPAGAGAISSLLCPGAKDKPIGEVLQSDEDAFRVRLDVDLCEASTGTLQSCGTLGCPVVDQVTAEVNMAFGWRQFNRTAPTDIITPGVQRYINTMPGSLDEALTFGAGSALPEDSDTSPDADAAAPNVPSTSTDSRPIQASCECTCEERSELLARSESLQQDTAAGVDPAAALAEARRFMTCSNQCQRQYLVCIMDEEQQQRSEERQARAQRQRSLAEACDCSCESISSRSERAAELNSRHGAGSAVSVAEIASLSACSGVCLTETINCHRPN